MIRRDQSLGMFLKVGPLGFDDRLGLFRRRQVKADYTVFGWGIWIDDVTIDRDIEDCGGIGLGDEV